MPRAFEAWIEAPDSQRIADELNERNAASCEHARNPCYLRCGVRTEVLAVGRWSPIPAADRLRWKTRLFKDAREQWPDEAPFSSQGGSS